MAHIIPHTAKEKKPVIFTATGKRKTSIARVRLTAGNGQFVVNERPLEQYMGRLALRLVVQQPFAVTGTEGKFDVVASITGGGPAGQAGALRHGLARALLSMNADLRKPLKAHGYLTRDAREKERRKVGCRKARRRPQYSKR
ncbi:MAG: 30S ribosomal protein S9 [Deltaproteobacteria bacterium]|nr:30S ribosomal protein S9 [Deltaproteobacteria bacterium]